MNRRWRQAGRLAIIAVGAGWWAMCSTRSDRAVVVLAAVSLTEPLDSVVERFRDRTDAEVHIAYGASGTLAQQIRSGAAADLFLTADTAWIERLIDDPNARVLTWRPYLNNRLVIVGDSTRRGMLNSLGELRDPMIRRIAIADPDMAPVGRYAKATLERVGMYTDLSSRLYPVENAHAVTTAVRLGAADAGFVYATDLSAAPGLRVIYEIPDSLHPPIVYGLVRLGSTGQSKRAEELYEHLLSAESLECFRRFGFVPIPDLENSEQSD